MWREKAGAIFHFVGCDMMKYLISDSVEQGFRRIERIVERRQGTGEMEQREGIGGGGGQRREGEGHWEP